MRRAVRFQPTHRGVVFRVLPVQAEYQCRESVVDAETPGGGDCLKTMNLIFDKPRKLIVPHADADTWRADKWRIEQKMDGRFAVREIAGRSIAGELMRDGSFVAFDCLGVDGQDISGEPLRARLRELDAVPGLIRPATGVGEEFLEAVLANGGEGIVAKRLDSPYHAGMLAIKRVIELACVVTEIPPFQAVKIADAKTGEPRGNVKMHAFKISKIRVGSIIKVIGMNLTEKGCVREGRLCSDTPDSWLVRY